MFFENLDPSFKTIHENRIYSLRLHCDDNYPNNPPTVHFISRINLPCVNQHTGKVSKFVYIMRMLKECEFINIILLIRSNLTD